MGYLDTFEKSVKAHNAYIDAVNKTKSYIVDGVSNEKKAAKIIYNATVSGVDTASLNKLASQLSNMTLNVNTQSSTAYNQDLVNYLSYEQDKTDVGTVLSSTGQGALDAVKGLITATTGYYNPTWQSQSFESYQNALNQEDMGTIGSFATDLGYGLGNTAVAVAASAINPVLGASVEFTSQAGQAYNQAKGEGKSDKEATTYAVITGGVTAALESTLGVVGGSKSITKAISKLAGEEAAQSVLSRYIASMGGEFVEETIEGIAQPIIYNATTSGEDQNVSLSDALYQGLLGAFTGGIFETVGTSSAIRNQNLNTKQALQSLTDSATQYNISGDTVQAAYDATRKAKGNFNVAFTDGDTSIDFASNTLLINKDTANPDQLINAYNKNYLDIKTGVSNISDASDLEKTAVMNDTTLTQNEKIYKLRAIDEIQAQKQAETDKQNRIDTQGDSLDYVEGGLTLSELLQAREKENTNYVGKSVITPDGNGKISSVSDGVISVTLEDGTINQYNADQLTNARTYGTIPDSVNLDEELQKSIDEINNLTISDKDKAKRIKELKNLYEKTYKKEKKTKNKEQKEKSGTEDSAKDSGAYETKNTKKEKAVVDDTKGTNLSKSLSSLLSSDIVTDNLAKKIRQDYYKFNREKQTNAKTLNAAASELDTQAKVNEFMSGESVNWSAKDFAKASILMTYFQETGDYDSASIIATKWGTAGTSTGRALQMMSILGRFTREGMLVYAQRAMDGAYKKLEQSNKKFADKYKEKLKLTDSDLKMINTNMEMVELLPDGRDKTILLSEIGTLLQDKIPPTIGTSVKAYTRISMLLNPKTNIRNILGNALIVPLNITNDFIGSGLDAAISKGAGTERTVGFKQKGYLDGAKKGLFDTFSDFKQKIDTKMNWGDRYEAERGKSFTEKTKLGKSLNVLDRVTSLLLTAGDRPFYEASFVRSINNQVELYNKRHSEKIYVPTASMVEVATWEALNRTWQDTNKVTEAAKALQNILNGNTKNKGGKQFGVGNLVLAFTKTPANLTKAVFDYSPVGFIKTITLEAAQFKNILANNQGNLDSAEVALAQRKLVDHFSKGITGTLVMAAGYLLSASGLLSGGADDDDDLAAFKRYVLGIQPYSVKINGKTYTYDWAQPVGTMLAIGAEVQQGLENKDASAIDVVIDALNIAGGLLYEQSFLQGLGNIFSSDNIMQGLIKGILYSSTMFVPAILNQFAQLLDPVQKETYEYGALIDTTINRLKARIPGLSSTLANKYDVFGNEITYSEGLNVFLNPSKVEDSSNINDAALEIWTLYQSTGDESIIPRVSPYYTEYDGTKYELTSAERSEWQKYTGDNVSQQVSSMIKTDYYQSLSDADKASAINSVIAYYTGIAKYNYLTSKGVDASMDNTTKSIYYADQSGLDVGVYLMANDALGNITADKDKNGDSISGTRKKKVYEYVQSLDIPYAQKLWLFKKEGYSLSDAQDDTLINYIENLDLTTEEKTEIYTSLYK